MGSYAPTHPAIARNGLALDQCGAWVFDCATHDSILKGDDAPTSVQAVLDVLAAVRDGTPVH